MGLYDSQIKQRVQCDDESLTASFVKLSGVVMGGVPAFDLAESEKTRSSIEEILKYYKVKSEELPESITALNDQLDYLLRPAGVARRRVKLTAGWHKDAIGAHLATLKETGEVIALIPHKLAGFDYLDFKSGKRVRVTRAEAEKIEEDAYCFYRPLPQRELTSKDFIGFLLSALDARDFIMIGVFALITTLVGMLTPYVTFQLFEGAVYDGDAGILLPSAVLLVGAALSTMLFGAARSLVVQRIQTRSSVMAQAALYMRVLSLPPAFFRKYTAGEIASRNESAGQFCTEIVQTVMTTGFTSLFSLLYLGQVFAFAPALAIPALAIILATLVVSLLTTFSQLRLSKKQLEIGGEESGLVFSLVTGVPKVKLTGSEPRAFAKWAEMYARRARLQYAPPALVRFSGVLTTLVSLAGTIILYGVAAATGVGVSDYMALTAAYGMTSGAFVALAGAAVSAAKSVQLLDYMKPLLRQMPEVAERSQVVTRLSGVLELSNVSFRYAENMPFVLNDISLRIKQGQYVAVVGKTGCGKSTLLRLLLGFEKPERGAIYYDGKDMSALDLGSLRRNIGVVMQDGKLFQGDIFSNIIISAPWLTMDDAWEAAEIAGIADDIHDMPMGMHTMISEGSGGISGGQRQRLMIARALAPRPRVLFFDEATSALDNITQKHVSDNLGRLKCTRIVIAHRLSTIKHADRILVLDDGIIAEDGSYDELLQKDGLFADLVRRQMLDEASE